MPIYVYSCETCGVQFEEMRSFSDTRMPMCPDGHTNVRRTFSPPAIHFKGSGWYITDSRKRSNSKADGKSESDGKATETQSDD